MSINNYFYRRGGAEVVFLEQNRLFEEIGWEVIPFSMRHPKNQHSSWQDWFVDEIEFGESYSLLQKALNAGKIVFSIEAQRKVTDLVTRVNPAVAHAHNVYHHISPAIFGRLKSLGVPTVLTLHDLKIACPAYKMLTGDGVCERCKGGAIWNVVAHRCVKNSRPLSMVIMVETAVHRLLGCYSRHVDRFVVPSRFYLEKFVEWGWPRDRFLHVPNFVDTEHLQPHGAPGRAFVFFGRLGPEKGLATFIRALALAGVKGRIVGTGPEEDKLRKLAMQTGADVDFFGYRSGDALFDVIRSARAMVLPSEWYENAPMSVLEAYALERPVIGAAIGGIPELIREGETGAIFQSGNAEALAARLTDFMGMSDDEILAMGKAGRRWVEEDFTAVRYRERLLGLYRDMGVVC
ncbi:MAG: glycosyltransferase family 4 protein [Desulfomicrobium sp.]|nr:glycosyltransferase family 4 protein [Desulfomicrobium sp.]MBV1748312.1 glycosyltransferase family 4 protein [Desulfomicrobium sp.]